MIADEDLRQEKLMNLTQYTRYINAQLRLTGKNKCRWCEGRLEKGLQHFDHDGGWPVDGFAEAQWLYKKCTNCGYLWSVWKLGIANRKAGMHEER